MHNRTKLICGVAILTLAFSAGLSAQPAERGRDAPGGEARERAGDRPAATTLPERAQEAVETGADAAAGAMRRAREGVGRGMEAFERQMAQFKDVHARRSAQLQRLRELALENGRDDVLQRVDELIERESERFSRQISRLQDRIERTGLLPGSETVDNESETVDDESETVDDE